MDPKKFHERVASLQPAQSLGPDAVVVAILQHPYVPENLHKAEQVVWVKCPTHKSISAVRAAYRNRFPSLNDVFLRHGNERVSDSSLIGDFLDQSTKLVALEAIEPKDWPQRSQISNFLPPSASTRPPLRDVTNIASQSPTIKSPGSSTFKQPDHAQSSGEALGWSDFLFERRELIAKKNPAASIEQRRGFDQNIAQEWYSLNLGQRSFYTDRAKKITAITPAVHDHWAFYAAYYEAYFRRLQSAPDPHLTFDSLQYFFSEVLSDWRMMNPGIRLGYTMAKSGALVDHPVPPCPTLPVQATARAYSNPLPPQPMPRHSSPADDREISSTKSESPASGSASSSFSGTFNPTHALHKAQDASLPPSTEDELQAQHDNAFLTDASTGQPNSHLGDIFNDCTAEQLENAVKKGVALLANIEKTLKSEPSEEADQWLKSVANIQKQAVNTKTVVGVVGATGAGKSSVINAMLDEERLVPTNCMRACTAVVTEISYNHETVPYRAEIEFISRQDWEKQLKIMFQDLLDGSGQVSRECNNEDSEAGVAYAQIKAVYPKLTKEMMGITSVEKLMSHANVACLGSTQDFESHDSLIFYKKLQGYVDSKEKSGTGDKHKKDRKPGEMEYWPLIRVVRLYVKSPCLSTGAVIVDLPGVHDSNQARAAVAQSYLKQCTGLWIVAPITRAVDDKSAKNLLGDTFKRQLKMDGGYTTVTFICSKTDDISITEAQDSLGLEEEMQELYARQEKATKSRRAFERQVEGLKDTKSDMAAALETADVELEVWEKLQEDRKDGQTVYRPKPRSESNKRKRDSSDDGRYTRKKGRSSYAENDSDDDFIDDKDEASDNDDTASDASSHTPSGDEEEQSPPLTEDEITEKISELRATKRDGRREKQKIDDEIQSLKGQMKPLVEELEKIDAGLSAKCIAGRNEYSRGAIQQDFAAGIKELDQELSEEQDAANFNPEVDVRDYDEVARSLPVFCVSARAYQKLNGRLKKDKNVPGFEDVEQTEIPKLQQHCKKLTEAGRETTCRRFLSNLIQLLNSLRLWSHNDGTGRNLTEGQLKQEARVLAEKIDKLDRAFEKCVQDIVSSLSDELESSIYNSFPNAITSAKTQANDSVAKWHAPVNRFDRAEGGYYWATYKAIVRRDGVFTNAAGGHDFNDQLTTPIIQHVAGPWERVMSRRVPSIVAGLATAIGDLLTKFHQEVESRAIRNGASMAAFMMLKSQLPVYRETFKDAANAAKTDITTKQRDINRQFVPIVTEHMLPVYASCTAEYGSGQYLRMKNMMSSHVNEARVKMFDASTRHVRDLLKKMVKESSELLLTKTDEVLMSVKRDYTGVVIGQDAANRTKMLPREQRLMRRAVLEIVDEAEHKFKQAVGLEREDPEEQEDQKDPEEGPEDDEEMPLDKSNSRQSSADFEAEANLKAVENARDVQAADRGKERSSVKTEPDDDEVVSPTEAVLEQATVPEPDPQIKTDAQSSPESDQWFSDMIHHDAIDGPATPASSAHSIAHDEVPTPSEETKPAKATRGWKKFLGF